MLIVWVPWCNTVGFTGTCFVVWEVFHIYLQICSKHRVRCFHFTLFCTFCVTVPDTTINSEILYFTRYFLCNWCRYALRSSDLLCLLVNQTRRNGEPKHGWNVNDDISLPVPKCKVEAWSTVATPHKPQQVNFWVHLCAPNCNASCRLHLRNLMWEELAMDQVLLLVRMVVPSWLTFCCPSTPTCCCPLMCEISLTKQHIFISLVVKVLISSMWPGTWQVTEWWNKASKAENV